MYLIFSNQNISLILLKENIPIQLIEDEIEVIQISLLEASLEIIYNPAKN
jgi:hypothetical protein